MYSHLLHYLLQLFQPNLRITFVIRLGRIQLRSNMIKSKAKKNKVLMIPKKAWPNPFL